MAKYSRLRGVTKEAVSKAVREGRIPSFNENGRRLIDPELADQEWQKNTNPSVANEESRQKKLGVSIEEDKNNGPSYSQSRSIREAYQARLAKLSYEEKLEKLVSAEKVKVTAFTTARIVRESVLNIPNKISYQLATETDSNKIHLILTEALIEALEELAVGKLKT